MKNRHVEQAKYVIESELTSRLMGTAASTTGFNPTSTPSTLIKLPFVSQDGMEIVPPGLDESAKGWLNSLGLSGIPSETFKRSDSDQPPREITHAGFLSYLALCWSKEFGCVINPGVLYNCFLTCFARKVLQNPDMYKYLFSNSDTKVEVEFVGDAFDYEKLINVLRRSVANNDFLACVVDTNFASDIENAGKIRSMIFANAGVPFFNYSCSKCGIPSVTVEGSVEDWKKLIECIRQFAQFAPKTDASYVKDNHNKWVKECLSTVQNIVTHAFGEADKKRDEFFSNIFHYGKNGFKRSGQDDKIVSGWAKVFVGGSLDDDTKDLHKYDSQTIYLPVTNKHSDDHRYFVQFASLGYSTYDKDTNVLKPHYCFDTYEVTDKSAFDKIAQK